MCSKLGRRQLGEVSLSDVGAFDSLSELILATGAKPLSLNSLTPNKADTADANFETINNFDLAFLSNSVEHGYWPLSETNAEQFRCGDQARSKSPSLAALAQGYSKSQPEVKVESDLCKFLDSVELCCTQDLAENSGSDKENELLECSLADLYFTTENEPSPLNRSEIKTLFGDTGIENKSHNRLCDQVSRGSAQTCKSLELRDSSHTLQNGKTLNFLNDGNINLSLAKKNTRKVFSSAPVIPDSNAPEQLPIIQNSAGSEKVVSTADNIKKLLKAKPSLFVKVLCCKAKSKPPPVLPKHPETLKELLHEMDYCKYFSFDTPSPDDIIKRKQKLAFRQE